MRYLLLFFILCTTPVWAQETTATADTAAAETTANAEAPATDAVTGNDPGPDQSDDWLNDAMENFTSEDLWRLGTFLFILVVAYILGRILKGVFHHLAEKRKAKNHIGTGATLEALARSVSTVFVVIGIKISTVVIDLSSAPSLEGAVVTISDVLLVIAAGIFFFFLVDVPVELLRRRSTKTETKLDDMLVPLVQGSLRIVVMGLVGLQILQVLSDKPLTSLLAGLGIGSLAVAFAAQNSISHLFGSLMIFADRPFELGERVIVDGHDGTVESVGLRSTRVRRLDGHLVTIPNGKLAEMSIHNVGKRRYIRKVMNVTITYDTPPDKIERAVEILKELLDNHEGMNEEFPPRVYFNDLNADSLNIIVIFWYFPPAYWDFLAFCERINLELFRRFADEGIDFAFPSQTVYLAGDDNRPLTIGLRELPGGKDQIGDK